MYEETKASKNIDWKSLITKLLILLLIVFLICFLIFKPKKVKKNTDLSTNFVLIKEVATRFIIDDLNLKNIGDEKKFTLEELYNAKVLNKQKDKDNNVCNAKDSYINFTKVKDNEYVLKIYLECGETKDSKTYKGIKKDVKPDEIKPPKDSEIEVVVEEEKRPEEKPNDNTTNNDDTKENVDNKKPDSNSNDKGDKNNKPKKQQNIRYKHIKYGEWQEGNDTGKNIENSTKTVSYYEYCLNGNCIIDRLENKNNYVGYQMTFSRNETIPIYRIVYVIYSNKCCIKGFTNTGKI